MFIDYFIQKVSFHVASDSAQSDELENDAEFSQVFKTMFFSNSFINAFHTVNTSQFFKFIEKNEKILMNVTKKAVNKTLKNARKKETKIEKKTVIYETDYWEIEIDIMTKDNNDLTVDEMRNKKNKKRRCSKIASSIRRSTKNVRDQYRASHMNVI